MKFLLNLKKYSSQLLFSLFIGLLLTLIIPFGIVNYSLNKSLEGYFVNIVEGNHQDDFEKTILQTDLTNNLNQLKQVIAVTRDSIMNDSWCLIASKDSCHITSSNKSMMYSFIGSNPISNSNSIVFGGIPKDNISKSNMEILNEIILPTYFSENCFECLTNPNKIDTSRLIGLNSDSIVVGEETLPVSYVKQHYVETKVWYRDQALPLIKNIMDIVRLSPAYKLRIYLNGTIQFLTFWLFFTILVQLLFFHYRYSNKKIREAELLLKLAQEEGSDSTKEKLSNHKVGDNILIDLLKFPLVAFGISNSYSDMIAVFDIKKQDFENEMYNEYDFIKDLVSFIALIGFIGTVWGILTTLPESSKVFTDDGTFVKQAYTQEITFKLGVAFDTTFVALILTIIIMPVFKLISYLDTLKRNRYSSEVFEFVVNGYLEFQNFEVTDEEVFEQLMVIINSKLEGVTDNRLAAFKEFLNEKLNKQS